MHDKPLGAMIVVHDFSSIGHDEFNDWYDTEHIPERLGVNGFINAQRWLAIDNPRLSVVTYDVQHANVLRSPAYKAVSGAASSPWTRRINRKCKLVARYVGEQILPGDRACPEEAGGLLLLAMNVNADIEQEFNRWNDTEHFPRLAAIPGVLAARRIRCTEGDRKYLAVYHTSEPGVVDSPAWLEARETPWTWRIRPHTRDRMRIVCERYHRLA
jgi:hypothetical protein